MNDRNGTNWLDRVKAANDEELAKLAEAVEREKQKRRRGMRNLNRNPEARAWDRRAL